MLVAETSWIPMVAEAFHTYKRIQCCTVSTLYVGLSVMDYMNSEILLKFLKKGLKNVEFGIEKMAKGSKLWRSFSSYHWTHSFFLKFIRTRLDVHIRNLKCCTYLKSSA